MLFPSAALDAIEQAIARVERLHDGEMRFAIETALTPLHIWHEVAPRDRALEVFASCCACGIPRPTTAF